MRKITLTAAEKQAVFKEVMKENGARGGKARLEKMTAKQRSEVARAGGKRSGEVRAAKAAAEKAEGTA